MANLWLAIATSDSCQDGINQTFPKGSVALNSQRVSIDTGTEISYCEAGAGTALVLLHGIGSTSASWSGQLDEFADEYRVVAWDAPGYGESTSPSQQTPAAVDYAGALAALLDRLSIERCHLAGNSLGALIAAAFQRLQPDRLLSLTLSDAATGYGALSTAERDEKLAQRLGDLHDLGLAGMAALRTPKLLADDAAPAVVERVQSIMATMRPEGYEKAARMLTNANILEELTAAKRHVRTLVVTGAEDRITTPKSTRRIADAISGARYELIEGAGHLPYLERPESFNRMLRQFLADAS